MILHVLDENLTYKGRLESYKSLKWKEQYQGEGGFTLVVDDTDRNAALLQHGYLLYRADRKTAMHVVNVVRSTKQRTITAGGYTELCILERRAMMKPYTVSNAESSIYGVATDNLRGLPVEMSESQGFADVWEGLLEEMSLSDAVYSVGKYSGLGVKMVVDVNNKKRILTVYKGADKTYNPATGGRVFSHEYGNLRELTITEDDDLYKNVAIVRGLGQDEQAKELVIGAVDGLDRREMLVKVADQSSKQTDDEYIAEMRSAGENALLKQRKVQTFEAEISPKDFGTAYDLGDIATCNAKRYGLRFDRRITEFTQTVENGVSKIVFTLGEPTITYAESITGKGNTVSGKASSGSAAGSSSLSAYPVGSIYLSVNETPPDQLFGGVWEQLKDTFLLAAGDTYEAGSEGGESEHELTAEETPHVTGKLQFRLGSGGSNMVATYPDLNQDGCFTYTETAGDQWKNRVGSSESSSMKTSLITFDNGGQNKPHNNMPPYLAVYMWKRTA